MAMSNSYGRVGAPEASIDADVYNRTVTALRDRERELSQLVDMVPSHLWRLSADGEPTFFNKRMVDFLGLAPFEGTDLSPKRESKGFRYGWLQRLLKRPPPFARDFLAGKQFRQRQLDGDRADDKVTENIFAIRKRLLNWNKVPLEKRVIPVPVQQQIRDRLAGEVAELGRLIGRDLSHWLQVREGRTG